MVIKASLNPAETGTGNIKLELENDNEKITDINTQAELNAYIHTYLDITITDEDEEKQEQSTNQENQANIMRNNLKASMETEKQEESEAKGYLAMEIKSNDYEHRAYKNGEKYIYSVELEDVTPEELRKAKEWSEEDIQKRDELLNRIEQLSSNETLTEEQSEELSNAQEQINELKKKYALGEFKELLELQELKANKNAKLQQDFEEYSNLKSIQNPTEEQTACMEEIYGLIGEYIDTYEEIQTYISNIEGEPEEEQETQIENFVKELERKRANLIKLTEEQENRLAVLEEKESNGEILNSEDVTIKNIELKVNLPKYVKYKSAKVEDTTGKVLENPNIVYNEQNNNITLKLEKYPEDMKKLHLDVETQIGDIGKEYSKDLESVVNLQYEQLENEVTSSDIAKLSIGKMKIETIKTAEGLKEINSVADEITFKLQINNIGGLDCYTTDLLLKLPEELLLDKIYYGNNEEELEHDESPIVTEEGIKIKAYGLLAGKSLYAYIKTTVTSLAKDKDLEVKSIFKYRNSQEDAFEQEYTKWNVTVGKREEQNDNQDDENQGNNNQTTNTYSISGFAWKDENADGIKSEQEALLKNIKVTLVNVENKKIIGTTLTDNNGKYAFSNLQKGQYQILFEYNNKEYNLTEYKKVETEEINSNAIKMEDGTAVTDIIKIENENIRNVNIGLVDIPKFDLSLTKRISKIIVQNAKETKTYNYNDVELGKVEIDGKYINNTTVLVEYKIKVLNEGDVTATVEKIADYMPKDMTFTSDLNTNWVQENNGNLYNTELSKIAIEPGESKEITLVLKKKMTEDNTGTTNNRAEIIKTTNVENLLEYDSKEGNLAQEEDDISNANVIVGIKTGNVARYIIITIISLLILGTGIYYINKKVTKGV